MSGVDRTHRVRVAVITAHRAATSSRRAGALAQGRYDFVPQAASTSATPVQHSRHRARARLGRPTLGSGDRPLGV